MPAKPSYLLRALDPKTERDLYREAYQWRLKPSKVRRKQVIPFEEFAADDPTQITLGLFNGELVAVYFFHQIGESEWQAHFTSRRDADKWAVLRAAQELVDWFKANNLQMTAYILARNTPLCHFVEAAGLTRVSERQNKVLQSDTDGVSLPPANETFVEYRSGVIKPGPLR